MQLKPYKKDFEHSYSFGVFPTLELLDHQAEHVTTVLVSSKGEKNEGVSKITEICERRHIRLEANDRLVERLSPRENVFAIGVFEKYEQSLTKGRDHVALVNPADMGNLGTIMRTMLGFGVLDLALVRPAADAFDGSVLWVEPENGFAWSAPQVGDIDASSLPTDWSPEASAILASYLGRLLQRDHTEGAALWLVDQSGYQATPAAAYARVLGEAALHVALRAGVLARRDKRDEIDAALAWRGVRAYETSYHSLPTLGSIL